MSKYTKGPLVVKVFAAKIGDDHEFHIVAENGECIATCWGQDDTAEANARLIAAAPEMLEALKGMIEGKAHKHPHAVHPSGIFCHVCGVNSTVGVHAENCPVLIAEIAIAKAEGRSE